MFPAQETIFNGVYDQSKGFQSFSYSAAAGLDFLIDQEKIFQDKYNWGDSEEIWDDTEQLPEEIDEPDEMEEQLDREKQCE